jgi:hypothetical protein
MANEKSLPGAQVDFGKPGASVTAKTCDISFSLPSIPFPPALSVPFAFPPAFPIPKLNFSLSCDPTEPIDISAGLANGGGRIACIDDDPDLEEAA